MSRVRLSQASDEAGVRDKPASRRRPRRMPDAARIAYRWRTASIREWSPSTLTLGPGRAQQRAERGKVGQACAPRSPISWRKGLGPPRPGAFWRNEFDGQPQFGLHRPFRVYRVVDNWPAQEVRRFGTAHVRLNPPPVHLFASCPSETHPTVHPHPPVGRRVSTAHRPRQRVRCLLW